MTAGPADPKALQVLPSWVSGSPVPPGSRIGKILQNEYLLKGLLGEGELGVTYEAENTRLRGRWAVLMLKRELRPTQGMMLQVRDDLRKAEPLAKLGLMPVRMIIDQHQIPGFATELLEGETLRRRLQRGPLRVERALAVALQVARALDALHKAGAVHGDLRPENIFLVRPTAKSSYAGKVVIVEHSFHHLRRREPGLDDRLPLYKLMYRPPELLLGERGPHPGADVFDLGAILHEALTGKPAFYADDADFVLDNLGQPPKALEPRSEVGLSTTLAQQISVLITSACARDPDERLPDMGEFIAAIEQIIGGSGLKLPEVVVEAAESRPEVPAAPSDQAMARVLERRSGVFAIISPPGATPAAAPAPAPAPAAAPAAPVAPAAAAAPRPEAAAAERPTTPPVISPEPAPARTPEPPAELKPNLPQTITAPKKKVTRLLQALSGSFPVLTVSPDGSRIEESLSRPSDPLIPPPTALVESSAPPAPAPAPAAAAPVAPPPAAPPPAAAPTAVSPPPPSVEPAVAPAAPPSAPVAVVEPSPPSAVSPVAPPQVSAAASPATTAPEPAASPPAAAAPPPSAPAAPARPAGIPADLARALLQSRQKSPPAVEPSAGAPPPSGPPPGPPAAAPNKEGGAHPEAQKVTVPPVAPASPEWSAPAAGAGGVVAAVGAVLASERVAPAGPAPTPQGVPAVALPSREITLAGDELIEAAEGPRSPPSISDAMTRPLLAAVNLASIGAPTAAPPATPSSVRPPFTEQATQPVLRRFPIEEQATQAKLPALDAISAQPTVAAPSVSVPPAAEPATATPPPSPTPSPGPEPAASTPPVEKPSAPKSPPRVSQLIQALQRGEMDAVKAITEAARSHAAATSPSPPSAPSAPSAPSVSGAQPSTPTSGSPAPGRVSPGLMAPIAPLPPTSTGAPEAAIATTKVATNPKLPLLGEAGLRAFIVRHQEAVSMIAGAVLMLLIGLVVLALLH